MFLKRIYKEWRLLFWVLLLFIGAQVFFMAKAIETVPFFLYNMYSKDHRPVDSIAVYLARTPYGYVNTKQLSGREEEMLMGSIGYYCNLHRDGDGTTQSVEKRFKGIMPSPLYHSLQRQLVNDSTALKAFPNWWRNYLRSVMNNDYQFVEVVRSYVYNRPPYAKSPIDSSIFYVQLK